MRPSQPVRHSTRSRKPGECSTSWRALPGLPLRGMATVRSRLLRGSAAVGGAGRLGVNGGPVAARAADPARAGGLVLREVFGFGFPEVASAVGRSEAACRQLAVRARRHMDAGRPRFETDRKEREELAERFFDAFTEGNIDGLLELLAADVQMVGDSGGKAPQWGQGVFGADNVARLLAAIIAPFLQIGGAVEPHEVNGQPGAILRDRDGKVLNTLTLDILDGQIQTIRSVINPDKLGHLGPVADAWAVVREAQQARRPTD